jgi:hypothetical protein
MYSAKKVEENLQQIEQREGWRPIYHTLEEVNEFKEYVNSVVEIEKKPNYSYVTLSKSIPYTKREEIRRWIINDQLLCTADYGYWESRYAYVANECGEIVKFVNRKSQEIFDSVIADLDENDSSKEILAFGVRQSGIGTKTMLVIAHRLLFHPYTTALIASPMPMQSDLSRRIMDVLYESQPWWLVPRKTSKGGLENKSVLSIQSGIQPSGLAQGWTPQCIYVNGVGNYPNAIKTFEEGLLRAVHSSSRTFLVLQGDGKNSCSYFGSLYRYAKEYYFQGKFRFLPLFIPWPVCTDIYPGKAWIDRYPIPTAWRRMRETKEHVAKCEKFIRETPYLAKIMGSDYSMPAEQQWYWESQFLEAKRRDILDFWLASMPADDSHFTSSAVNDEDLDNIFPSPVETQKRATESERPN